MADATMGLETTNDYRLCPLKATRVLAFWNLDPDPDVEQKLRVATMKIRADGEPPRVEYIGGQCDGPRCAWYDQTVERCAVLSIDRSK